MPRKSHQKIKNRRGLHFNRRGRDTMNIECECGNTIPVDEGRLEEVRMGPENITGDGKAAEDVDDTVYCLECGKVYSIKERLEDNPS